MAVDLHTRQLRYFVALAEELHFTKAASRLFVAQQSLSSQIRQLEERVGVQLLRRTTRQVELTRAGEAFLVEARTALEAIDRAFAAAQSAQRSEAGTLSLGFMVSAALELTAPILAEFSRRFPHVNVDLHEYDYSDPTVGLLKDIVDVGFVRPPVEGVELRYAELFSEPRVLVVGAAHPLAERESVTVAEVLAVEEPMILPRCPDAAWTAFWNLDEYRGGPATDVAFHTATLLEELEVIALGRPCAMISALAVERYAPRPGVRFIPICDVSGSTVTVAWRPERETDLLRAFVETAIEVRDRETDLVRMIESRAGTAQPS
jgi:DNA-binding transcriptional LysR family regulator